MAIRLSKALIVISLVLGALGLNLAKGWPVAVSCIDCHMPVTGVTASDFNIRSHTLKIIPPQEAERLGMPSSCSNSQCHADKNMDWLKQQFSMKFGKSSQ